MRGEAVMWDSRIDDLDRGRLRRVKILHDGRVASYADILERWQSDEVFRAFFIRLLAVAPQDAYLWETPPITRTTAKRGFEFVLADSPDLARLSPDPHAFAPHFEAAEAEVVAFANLGGDALLVAPTPRAGSGVYPHLAAFARGAPTGQQHAFWRAVGAEAAGRLSDRPLWLSTCGLGVAWLHARLDSWPKYYTYQPYRAAVRERDR
jgi:hypothetical protein